MRFIHILAVVILTRFHVSWSERRIISGRPVVTDPKRTEVTHQYMVYLLSADEVFLGWLCGGAIISQIYILTSAACLMDVDRIFVISGLDKYVPTKMLEDDACTKDTKRRVIRTCVPEVYQLNSEIKLEMNLWSKLDIGIGHVDPPFDLGLTEPPAGCTWAPRKIEINYNKNHQHEDVDAFTFGWGSTTINRENGDTGDVNAPVLLTTEVLISNVSVCKKQFHTFEMDSVIEKYMLCTMGTGRFTYTGEETGEGDAKELKDGCALRIQGKCIKRLRHSNTEDLIIDSGTNTTTQRHKKRVDRTTSTKSTTMKEDSRRTTNASIVMSLGDENKHNILRVDVPSPHMRNVLPINYEVDNLQKQFEPRNLIGIKVVPEATVIGPTVPRKRRRQKGVRHRKKRTTSSLNTFTETIAIVTEKPKETGTKKRRKKLKSDPITFEDIMALTRKSIFKNGTEYFTRRNGICQNDHGGPLVTWVGGRQKVIGVAAVFAMDSSDRKCHEPDLYTSTYCNSKFIQCVLESADATRKRFCDLPAELRGFKIVERRISWDEKTERQKLVGKQLRGTLKEDLFERPVKKLTIMDVPATIQTPSGLRVRPVQPLRTYIYKARAHKRLQTSDN